MGCHPGALPGRGAPVSDPAERWTYTLRVDPHVERATVDLCGGRARLRHLRPATTGFASALLGAWSRHGTGRWIRVPRSGNPISLDAPARCVRYRIRLPTRPLARTHGFLGRSGETVVLPAADLLWFDPERIEPATLHLDLPPGVAISSPWTTGDDGDLVLPRSTWRHRGIVALGSLRPVTLEVAGGRLQVAHVGPPLAIGDAALHETLLDAAATAALPLGHLPAPSVQVLVFTREGSSVHFGMAERGGGPGVLLLVGQDVSREGLRRDWVMVHEFLHLVHPHLPREEAWFGEGLATYLGPVLRARAGWIDADDAASELFDGFRRGAKSTGGLSLRAESRALDRRHRYWAVYWGGAAILLQADLELRCRSHGARSLDDLLRALHDLTDPDAPPRPLASYLRQLPDTLSAPLEEAMAERLDAPGFLPLTAIYERLGIDPVTGHLGARAPARTTIFAPRRAPARLGGSAAVTAPSGGAKKEVEPPAPIPTSLHTTERASP